MNHHQFKIVAGALLVGLAFGTVEAGAQELKFDPTTSYNPSVYITPEAGYFNPDNRFGTRATGAEVGLSVGKAINPSFDVRVNAGYARVRTEGDRYQQALGGIEGLWFPTRAITSFPLRPFLVLGGGAENDRRNVPNFANSRTSPYGSYGAGVQYAISDQFAAELAYKQVVGFQRSDVFNFRRSENNYVTAGLTYYFDKTPAAPTRVAQAAPPPAPTPAPSAPPPPPPRFVKQTVSATELFAFDKAVLRLPQPKLDEIVTFLKQNPQVTNARITGYTDRIGSKAYNVKLSERRAAAVKAYFVKNGIDGSRLTTMGKGEEDPVTQCSEKNRAALIKCLEPNRRVEVEDITVEKRVQ